MVEQVKSSSAFYQFLPKMDQNGYAAISGIMEGEHKDLFKEYDVVFLINQNVPGILFTSSWISETPDD